MTLPPGTSTPEDDGYPLATAFVKVSPDTSDFADKLADAVAASLRTLAGRITGNPAPETEPLSLADFRAQAEADAIYIANRVVTANELRRMRFGLGPRPEPANRVDPLLTEKQAEAIMAFAANPGRSCDDEKPDPPTIRLPDVMGNGINQQIRTIEFHQWREVFPGLQAVLNCNDENGEHIVLFRLTPKD